MNVSGGIIMGGDRKNLLVPSLSVVKSDWKINSFRSSGKPNKDDKNLFSYKSSIDWSQNSSNLPLGLNYQNYGILYSTTIDICSFPNSLSHFNFCYSSKWHKLFMVSWNYKKDLTSTMFEIRISIKLIFHIFPLEQCNKHVLYIFVYCHLFHDLVDLSAAAFGVTNPLHHYHLSIINLNEKMLGGFCCFHNLNY